MTLNKVLIDTNVCLDAMQKRKPFVWNAAKILDRSERKDFQGFVSAHSFDTLFYILSKTSTKRYVYEAITGLRRTIDIAAINQNMIDKALQLRWSDFEDAVHYQAALSSGCDAIVTRNENDFKESDLPVFSPLEFLEQLNR